MLTNAISNTPQRKTNKNLPKKTKRKKREANLPWLNANIYKKKNTLTNKIQKIDLVFIVKNSITRVLQKLRSITTAISALRCKNPIRNDHEHRSCHRHFDLPQRRHQILPRHRRFNHHKYIFNNFLYVNFRNN